ncbi:MAG: hypothetical protein KIT69_11380 [Propionibacteriaceae bacterium]|nr:hypothetical protein [Propionibacteriaceae bacterium]
MSTPETRRDTTVAALIEIGACVYSTLPLAHPDAPHLVVAYEVRAGQTHPDQAEALAALRAETETALADLIPWTPEPEPEPLPEVAEPDIEAEAEVEVEP